MRTARPAWRRHAWRAFVIVASLTLALGIGDAQWVPEFSPFCVSLNDCVQGAILLRNAPSPWLP